MRTKRRYSKTRSKGKLTYKMRGWHRGGNDRRRSRNSGRGLGRSSHSLQFPLSSKHNPSVPPSNATTRKAKEPTSEKYIHVRSEEEEEEETGGEGWRAMREARRLGERQRQKEAEEARRQQEQAKRKPPGARNDKSFDTYPDADSDALTAEEAAARLERRESWRRRHRRLRLLKKGGGGGRGHSRGGHKRKRTRRRPQKKCLRKKGTRNSELYLLN